jgi:hypothetical protein
MFVYVQKHQEYEWSPNTRTVDNHLPDYTVLSLRIYPHHHHQHMGQTYYLDVKLHYIPLYFTYNWTSRIVAWKWVTFHSHFQTFLAMYPPYDGCHSMHMLLHRLLHWLFILTANWALISFNASATWLCSAKLYVWWSIVSSASAAPQRKHVVSMSTTLD